MRQLDIGKLIPGEVTKTEYYSESGELLLSKGVTINDRHLQVLRRRNIFEIYTKDRELELKRILDTHFEELGAITFDGEAKNHQPRALTTLHELRCVRPGEDGLKQLLATDQCTKLDRELKTGRTADRPIGPALKNRIRQISPYERDSSYKLDLQSTYERALIEVTQVLHRLADAEKIGGAAIRAVVEQFMRTFITDHNILLNLACTKNAGTDHLYHHTLNVCLLSINIATASDYSEEQVVQIGMGALLHDVGMLLIPAEIRCKKGRLTTDEWFEVQKHPVLGLHLLERVTNLPQAVPYIAYQIHERENGKGYPKQRTGRLIHCYAKIVQTADIFEAISSPRSYRPALAAYKGMEMLIKMTRQGLLDGEFVKAFLTYSSLFPIGSMVELSDKRVAKVVGSNGTSFTKPLVSIVCDGNGRVLGPESVYQVDLSTEIDIQVIRALPFNYLEVIGLMDGF